MRYDLAYETLAKRATAAAVIDIEAFIQRLLDSGVAQARIDEMLREDLATGGPIFGKFFRGLGAASVSSVATAADMGASAGMALSMKDPQIQQDIRELKAAAELEDIDIEELVRNGDPEALEVLNESIDDVPHVWRAALVNTCPFCLPLHGVVRTLRQWKELGLHPRTIHEQKGLQSDCQCKLLPEALGNEVDNLREPLVRAKLRDKLGKVIKGSKRTARSIAQQDIDKAEAAIVAASDSEEGRRVVRLLGQVNKEG